MSPSPVSLAGYDPLATPPSTPTPSVVHVGDLWTRHLPTRGRSSTIYDRTYLRRVLVLETGLDVSHSTPLRMSYRDGLVFRPAGGQSDTCLSTPSPYETIRDLGSPLMSLWMSSGTFNSDSDRYDTQTHPRRPTECRYSKRENSKQLRETGTLVLSERSPDEGRSDHIGGVVRWLSVGRSHSWNFVSVKTNRNVLFLSG